MHVYFFVNYASIKLSKKFKLYRVVWVICKVKADMLKNVPGLDPTLGLNSQPWGQELCWDQELDS